MLKGSWKLAMVACLIAGLVGTSTAQASDAWLCKVVTRQEKRVAPMAKRFGAADKVNAGASKDSLKQSFVTLNKRIAAAAKNETAALKLLSSQA